MGFSFVTNPVLSAGFVLYNTPMTYEIIEFPEKYIPNIIRIIRRGVANEGNKAVKKILRSEIKKLEEYWKLIRANAK